ncbi:DUF2254 family protein [Donghicola mangrovi]|uniref:DUF2254 domain-containing protein n=1 Tax=Donghicola mangrovi TaxID=2729614 RepID=A0A850Q9Y5_9RHOB|nr:DUF2254 domain-containing protein [Donghicola mangrovi]
MLGKYLWKLRQVLKEIWVRVLAYGAVAVLAAMVSPRLAPYVPQNLRFEPGDGAVEQVLQIIASSMLAVTTFSLSIAVQAYSAAATSATPRATALLQQDTTTQNVLSTFLGAFLFSLMGIIGLEAGLYGDDGKFVLFVSTILVVGAIILALLRWITHLINFGRMSDTLARVEQATTDALLARLDDPFLGATPRRGAIPPEARALYPDQVGYVQHIDIAGLQKLADSLELQIWVAETPGSFVHPDMPLMYVSGPRLEDDQEADLRHGLTIGAERSFDQDPRFGLVVLSEIASRALSPAVNDPGTAIDVISRQARVLSLWTPKDPEVPPSPRIHMPPIAGEDLIDDSFHALARDGAAFVEVQIRLHQALNALAATNADEFSQPAEALAALAMTRATGAGMCDEDLSRLHRHARLARRE